MVTGSQEIHALYTPHSPKLGLLNAAVAMPSPICAWKRQPCKHSEFHLHGRCLGLLCSRDNLLCVCVGGVFYVQVLRSRPRNETRFQPSDSFPLESVGGDALQRVSRGSEFFTAPLHRISALMGPGEGLASRCHCSCSKWDVLP